MLLLIGFVALAMALAEGTGNEWLPLIMIDGHGYSEQSGALMYTVFSAAMVIGRIGGGYLVTRWGRATIFAFGVSAAVAGMAIVSLVSNPLAAGIAVAFWGLGISVGFPLALSAAADRGENPAAQVSAVATIGYIALLAGPPTLGFLGSAFGLRTAMLLPLCLVIVALLATKVMQPPAASKHPANH